jgi:hypothetical protein
MWNRSVRPKRDSTPLFQERTDGNRTDHDGTDGNRTDHDCEDDSEEKLFNILLETMNAPKELVQLVTSYLPAGIRYMALCSESIVRKNEITVCNFSNNRYFGNYSVILTECPQKWQICLMDVAHMTHLSIGIVRHDILPHMSWDDVPWSCAHTLSWGSDSNVLDGWDVLRHGAPAGTEGNHGLFEGCTECIRRPASKTIFEFEQGSESTNELFIIRDHCRNEKCRIKINSVFYDENMRPYISVGFTRKRLTSFDSTTKPTLEHIAFSWNTLIW